MIKTKQSYDVKIAIRNIIGKRRRNNSLKRVRWQSRNLRVRKPLDEIESLVLPSLDILVDLEKIEKKDRSVNEKILT